MTRGGGGVADDAKWHDTMSKNIKNTAFKALMIIMVNEDKMNEILDLNLYRVCIR